MKPSPDQCDLPPDVRMGLCLALIGLVVQPAGPYSPVLSTAIPVLAGAGFPPDSAQKSTDAGSDPLSRAAQLMMAESSMKGEAWFYVTPMCCMY